MSGGKRPGWARWGQYRRIWRLRHGRDWVARHGRAWWDRRGQAWCRRHGRRWLTALVAVTGLAVITLGPTAVVLLWRDHAEQQERARLSHRIGDPVRDGSVTFVVHQVRCGPTEEATHGRLCEVTMGVRNNGKGNVSVPTLAQTLHVSEGARHLPIRDGTGQFGTLEPRQAATAIIRYDLPLEANITHLEVRANTYARGVPVAVDVPYPLARPN